mgnify:CR=1 FL=1
MKKIRYILMCLIFLIFLICILPKNIYASKMMNFENLTIDNGLSQATAEAIIQDSDGYIWIGTNDGVNRYNGSEFKVFDANDEDENSIISNYVTALIEDKNKNLWVGTDEGLSKINLNDYSINHYRYNKKNKDISYYAIIVMYMDDDGNLYMGNNKGVYLYNEKIDDFDKIFGIENGLIDENVYSINKDKDGNLWIGTNQGLHKVDANSNKAYPYSVEDTKTSEWGKIKTIFFDNDNMWVGTSENGLKRVDLKNNKVKSFEVDDEDNSKLKSLSIRDIMKDSSGNIWMATDKGISQYINDEQFITYNNKSYDNNSLAHNIVFTLMEDESGLIWAGTYTGVSIFDSKNIIELYKNDPLDTNSISDNVVMGAYEDEDGLLWIGTGDRGLNIIDRKTGNIDHIFEGDTKYDLSSNAINVISGKGNNIWIGTRNGLNKINKDDMTIEKYKVEDGLIDNNIKGLFIDEKNNLWIGTPIGLTVLNIETNEITDFTSRLIKAGIKEPYVRTVYEDKDEDGVYWIGGYISEGLIKFDINKDTIEMYSKYEENGKQVIVNTIRTIVEDEENNLWIGTNSGLLKFNKIDKKFKSYTEKDGLANNIVYQILKDNDKNIWMSTNNGISKFDIKNNKFTNLSSTDGLQSNEFNGNSAYRCSNGDFLFGGIKGLNIFNPQEVLQSDYHSKINFDSFEVKGEHYLNIDGNTFSYDKNFIRVKFFTTDYRANKNVQYFYKLEGSSHSDWIQITSNEVILTNLDPGKHKLRIKFRNNRGNISEEKEINFTIKPPFWKSNIAKFLYAMIIIIIIYNSINKMKKLDKLVEKRTQQLNNEMNKNKVLFNRLLEVEKSKNNYFINLSHELRTPLNVINSIEQLIRSFCRSDKELTKSKLEKYMDIMKSNTNRLLNLINNIMDKSKIENGKYKINKSQCDIVYIVEEATLTLKESIESSGIELIFDTDVEEKIINCDKYDIERCIVNLVSNAHKFTPNGGRISVTIKDLNNSVEITVEDTGIGIEKKYHDTIFDRYSQVVDKNNENKSGTGLGLAITKHIIDLHNGKIYLESEPNKGTKFIIILPIN